MSRTVHHVRDKHRDSTRFEREAEQFMWHWRFRGPMTAHRISALRYSAAVLVDASRSGSRPHPERVSRRLEAYRYPRTFGGGSIAYRANRFERAVRAADRVASRRALQRVRADADSAWDIDFTDPRHRHFAEWDSW